MEILYYSLNLCPITLLILVKRIRANLVSFLEICVPLLKNPFEIGLQVIGKDFASKRWFYAKIKEQSDFNRCCF